jgi:hypothetical protein
MQTYIAHTIQKGIVVNGFMSPTSFAVQLPIKILNRDAMLKELIYEDTNW